MLLQEEEHREHQVLDTDVQNYGSEIEESQIAVLIDNNLKGKTLYVDSMSTSRSSSISTHSCQNSRTSSSSMNSSISQQSSPDVLVYPMHNKAEKEYNFSRLNSQSKYEVVALGTEERPVASSYDTTAPEHKGERKMAAPSSESRRQFPEEMIIYLDYVEEVQSITKQGSCQEKRIFKFKSSPALPRKEKVEGSCDVKPMDQYETKSEKSSSSNSRTRADETVRRSRRSLSREHSSVKDIEYVIYYDTPCK
jgi:vacuolar protein sorting-associated protein IST1